MSVYEGTFTDSYVWDEFQPHSSSTFLHMLSGIFNFLSNGGSSNHNNNANSTRNSTNPISRRPQVATERAIQFRRAANPEIPRISEFNNTANALTIQQSLVNLGYDLGKFGRNRDGIDGKIGKVTKAAIKEWQSTNGYAQTGFLDNQQVSLLENQSTLAQNTMGTQTSQNIVFSSSGKTLLHPQLIEKMRRDPEVAKYVQITLDAAERNGLDGNLLANQFWQESRFKPHATSGSGARGISQIMPMHKGKFGLNTTNDFYDPSRSIEAGARMMAGLSQKYGSQELALVAYNGGGGAIDYARRSLGMDNINIDQWMTFMEGNRQRYGTSNPAKWRVQTYDYVANIDPSRWSTSQREESQMAMNGLDQQTQISQAGNTNTFSSYTM